MAFVFGAAVVWIAGQVLLGRRLPDLFNPQIEREIERLREEAIALSNWIVLGPTADIWPKHCPVCPADKGENSKKIASSEQRTSRPRIRFREAFIPILRLFSCR